VRAVVAIAPGLAGAFLPDSLAQIDIPVAIVAGAADEVLLPSKIPVHAAVGHH
jgi:predicted dienelactone hydrolase